MKNVMDIVRRQAEDAINELDAQGVVTAEHVADSVLRQTAYWEMLMPGGEKLLFVRFFSPVVQREEVFLGNILFNTFLSKTFARSVVESESSKAELVANDLESYYFLVRANSDVTQLTHEFRAEVERRLCDLFFGEQSEEKGIYGDVEQILSGTDSRFESFPVYAVPEFLAVEMEKTVRKRLLQILESDGLEERQKILVTAFAFLYGKKSGGDGDAQSFPRFIEHLATDPEYGSLLNAGEVKKAFNVSEVSKNSLKASLDNQEHALQNFRSMMRNLLNSMGTLNDSGNTEWVTPYAMASKKFIALTKDEYLDAILSRAQIGYQSPTTRPQVSSQAGFECRLCGEHPASAKNSMVLLGLNTFSPHNQRTHLTRQDNSTPVACVHCALFSWLGQKLLGTHRISMGGSPPKWPQVPKTYNLIFHYGRHNDAEIDELVRKLDLIQERVQKHQEKERDVGSIRKAIRELEERLKQQRSEQKRQELGAQLQVKQGELSQAESGLGEASEDLFGKYPWLTDSKSTYEVPAFDLLTNLQSSQTKVERHVLGLGLGGYRMILFVLPQIRPPSNKEHDFAQRRFSDSRVTVTALLSFMRELCGCDGPFYYQSLPTLTPDAFQRAKFYVRDEPISVQQAQNEYEVVTQLAWKLVWQRGSDGFVRKVVLAEKLLKDPLGTFADVMRDSMILGQTKGSYRRLPGGYRQDWKAQDLTEYAKFIQRLSKLQEVR